MWVCVFTFLLARRSFWRIFFIFYFHNKAHLTSGNLRARVKHRCEDKRIEGTLPSLGLAWMRDFRLRNSTLAFQPHTEPLSLSLSISFSDLNERPETETGTVYSHDSGFEGECYPTLPASPTTIPRLRIGSTSRMGRDRPRRQRTTSTSNNTIRPNEAIIRISNNRTIYTAGK